MKIIYVRHGKTSWNELKKLQGKIDISLNDAGRVQAWETKNILKNEKIDLIISSPLKRARETAEIINEEKNIPIIYDERIAERNLGEYEGLCYGEIDYESFWSYKKNINYEKAENIRMFFSRVYEFIDEIKEKYLDKNILIVAHGGVAIPFRCYFNGLPTDETLLSLLPNNCEVLSFEIN